VVIVARGGGSIEDLWSFNEEEVVRAIAASTIPVISAVGHETDTTLADFAADLRAPTPTAAAELAVPVRAELAAQVHDLQARRGRAMARLMAQARERLDARAQRLPAPQALLNPQAQRLDDLSERLNRALVHRTELAAGLLARHGGALRPALLTQRLARERERLDARRLRPEVLLQRIGHGRAQIEALDRLRRSLDPEAPLQRGYVLVTDGAGHVVKDRASAAAQPVLTLKFADGTLEVSTGEAPPSSTSSRFPHARAGAATWTASPSCSDLAVPGGPSDCKTGRMRLDRGMLMSPTGRLARLQYLPGSFRQLSAGDHVVCAVSGVAIPLDALRYWSAELQEAYASPEIATRRLLGQPQA
jgi:exodeoxyribonuclease VII large subunit